MISFHCLLKIRVIHSWIKIAHFATSRLQFVWKQKMYLIFTRVCMFGYEIASLTTWINFALHARLSSFQRCPKHEIFFFSLSHKHENERVCTKTLFWNDSLHEISFSSFHWTWMQNETKDDKLKGKFRKRKSFILARCGSIFRESTKVCCWNL